MISKTKIKLDTRNINIIYGDASPAEICNYFIGRNLPESVEMAEHTATYRMVVFPENLTPAAIKKVFDTANLPPVKRRIEGTFTLENTKHRIVMAELRRT